MRDVQFRILGPMEIIAGGPVKLPGAAERALLVQLLLAPGRTIPATVLVDRLWSESTLPVDPMNALQLRASKLRKALSAVGIGDVVIREGVGYRAVLGPEQVDALDFALRLKTVRAAVGEARAGLGYHEGHLRAYDEALELWRGEPLADFATQAWAIAESGRLEELRRGALTERAQIALALARHLEVIGDLEPLVSADPTQEALVGLLMLALYRAGRQADALDAYQRTRRELDDELGVEPSVSLRSLYERILKQDPELGEEPSLTPSVRARSRADEHSPGPTNLPTVERHLIGRDQQLDAVSQLLGSVRLLTLIGPGGAGKSSLALSSIVRARPSYPDGVFGVRLASVATGDQVQLAVADALGIPLDGAAADRALRDRLLTLLARRKILLLLDNCEHLVDEVASLVEDILGRCPNVTVLATSREALAVPDEVQVTVGPLETPPQDARPGEVLSYPAAQLFAERARALRPGLVFNDEALDAIGTIARSLDGIPLAIELAAARAASMSPIEIAHRLDDRFSLLTSGARTAEARQQTLRATVDWSYELLNDSERRVFNRLSVFQGGWTLTAAERAIGDESAGPGGVLDAIGRLVDRSMLVAESGVATRYWMLETLRHYAAERLAASTDARIVARRHAEYFRDFALTAEVELRGHSQRETMRRVRDEQPNLRAALQWFTGEGNDLDSALELAGALGLFWHLGRHLEGRELLGQLIAKPGGSPRARARALQAVSIVERPRACLVHPSPLCAETARESLAVFEGSGDAWHAALSKVLLAVEGVTGAGREEADRLLQEAEEDFAREQDAWGRAVIGFVRMETALKSGDVEGAIDLGQTTSTAFRELDDAWGLSATLYHLGWGLRQFGRYGQSARALEQAIDVAASAGIWNTVQWAFADLGILKVHTGDRAGARELFERAAAASQEVGDGAGEVLAEYGYGLLAQVGGKWDEAPRHFLTAVSGFRKLGTPVMSGAAILGLARCDEAMSRWDSARSRFEEALRIGRETSEAGLAAAALEGLARLELGSGNPVAASELVGEARSLRAATQRPPTAYEADDVARLMEL